MPRLRSRPIVLLSGVLLGGCGHEAPAPADGNAGSPPAPAAATQPQANSQFRVWHEDFPRFGEEVPQSPPNPLTYTRSRGQALERVVANLSGACTQNAWHMALEFFPRMGVEAVPLLIEAMDSSFQAADRAETVQNVVETMGSCARPEFAPALLRALEHPKEGVRDKAMHALIYSGDAAAVEKARGLFAQMTSRAQVDWLRAARAHLGEKVVGNYQALLADEANWGYLKKAILDETMKLPLPQSLAVLTPLWPTATGGLRLMIAGTLHANGDTRGTHAVRDALQHARGSDRLLAIAEATRGSLTLLLDDLLRLSIDDDPMVRAAIATAIAATPGENIDKALEVLALDPERAPRDAALAALGTRGYRPALDRVVDGIRTESGTRMLQALSDAVSARDAAAVPVIAERMLTLPLPEQRDFVSALGRSRCQEAFAPLRAYFLAPERRYRDNAELTTTSHTAIVLSNLNAAAADIRKLFDELPAKDYRRRAMLLTTLGNMANTIAVPAFQQDVFALYRRIMLDPAELPQMRLLVLHWLRKDLRIDDMKAIKARLADRETEPDPGMRAALNNFLFEFF